MSQIFALYLCVAGRPEYVGDITIFDERWTVGECNIMITGYPDMGGPATFVHRGKSIIEIADIRRTKCVKDGDPPPRCPRQEA